MTEPSFTFGVLALAGSPFAALGGLWSARATERRLSSLPIVPHPKTVMLGAMLGAILTICAPTSGIALAVLCIALGAVATCDADTCIIPDTLVITIAGIGIVFHPFAPGFSSAYLALSGVVLFASSEVFARHMRKWRGRTAFGGGDVKLIAAIGANVGWIRLDVVLFAGCVSAIAWHGLDLRKRFPLGPHLVAGLAFTAWIAPRISIGV
ncbi:prepilin peptidase [Novosphingobium acidiphilum]|uniref:prepilin peptidase n=1 Tax=Novosphingobium acidiphilum TaxID=505248 RepID=UPI000562FA4E|nr:A24 family peptidase [Novosphingobium acidiphilum]